MPLAALAGFVVTLRGVSASPRQLAERPPLLAAVPRTVIALPLLLVAAVGGGWWVAGAPLWPQDIQRAAPVWLVLALLIPVRYREGAGPWRAQMAVLAPLAASWAAAAPGPWWLMALIGPSGAGSAGAWACCAR